MQVFTGHIPFRDRTSVMAMLSIVEGKRSPRPTHPIFTEKFWTLMQSCWDQDPHSRPRSCPVEVLQGGRCVEGLRSPKCAAIVGCDNYKGPLCDGISVGGEWKHQ